MTENIYEEPKSELIDHQAEVIRPIATTGQRFLTMIIDFLGYIFLSAVIGFTFTLLNIIDILDQIHDYIFGILIMSLYYIPQEVMWGRTLGKLIMGTQVVSISGKPAPFSQIFGRTLIRFVPFEAFSFLGGRGHPQGWHDSWSKTKVVSLRKKHQVSQ